MVHCSDLALTQPERALYRQQTKAIKQIVIIILVKCKVYCWLVNCWNYKNIEKYILPLMVMTIII